MADTDETRIERVEGETFAVEPATPFLARESEQVFQALTRAFAAISTHDVRKDVVLSVREGSVLYPDVVVAPKEPDAAPTLVVEIRRESTDRFALGIKRLAYASAKVAEYWFIDPKAATLRVLLLDPATRQYTWPGLIYERDAVVSLVSFPTVQLPVNGLLSD